MMISIIIPVYNAEKYLRECIESCLNQTYKDVEIIAVNDGSTDGSSKILAEYSDRIKIVSKANGGIASAINTGISVMNGDWFKSVDADDLLYSNALMELINIAKNYGPKHIVYMDEELINDQNKTISSIRIHDCNSLSPFEQGILIYCNVLFGSFHTSLIHKSAFDDVGLYNEKINIAEDYEMILRLCFKNYHLYHVPKIIYGYRTHQNQTTHRYKIEKTKKIIRKQILKQFDKCKQKQILHSKKTCIRSREFLFGAYLYANRKIPSNKIKKFCIKHVFLYNVYIFSKICYYVVFRRKTFWLKGWFWAYKHRTNQRISNLYNKRFTEIDMSRIFLNNPL